MKSKIFVLFVAFLLLSSANLFAQSSYQKPPKDVMDVLDAAVTPQTSISPAKDKILLLEPVGYPSIAELSQPMLRLAGLRINPNTNGAHRQPYAVKLTLKNIADGKETPIDLPAKAQIISPQWSADGKYIAAGNITPNGIEMWIIETANGKAKMVKNAKVNTAFGSFSWMPDQKSLLVNLVPSKRGVAPQYQNTTPTAPNIQETTGKTGAIRTYQDLLRSPNDEALFEYYATSQLAVVAVDGKIKEIGQPAIFDTTSVSPDGNYVLTSSVQRPFSYLLPASDFPQEVEIWDLNGKSVYKVASVPLQDNIPVDGVTTAPRNYGWVPTESATLVWAEALDGGNPKEKVEFRDKLMKIAAPFSSAPTEIVKTQHRFAGRTFGERNGLMLYSDYNRDTRKRRLFMMDYSSSASAPKLISDLNVADRYNDIGQPVTRRLPNGFSVIQQMGEEIFLTGLGASVEGDRPFLRRMNLQTLKTEEVWRSGNTGQVSGSTNRFTSIGGISHLFFLLNGYAVLDNATMPVVGDPETVNDTFIKQINDSAKAAIDKGVEMGVVDPQRVGVGGHSYGAFMTANLLAHSDLFRAGIARSGAYNRTLTPFGFQGERRNFWEATELYTKISPFFFANKINEPILLIHGEADNNTGTFPIQSERLFAALQGTGGTARLVMLPHESHGYAAKESVEHTLFEMINWFDKYVKNAKPRENKTAAQTSR
ncbi:MAG: prolyl oligopeptidase family serine peptidase [Acidobacteria bacterium]|nr:prolyl oligopeptidase family serine peptidase [Acidobacteriota bacterium]